MLEPLLNKVPGLQAWKFILKNPVQVFPVNIVKFLITDFLQVISGPLVLPVAHDFHHIYKLCHFIAKNCVTSLHFKLYHFLKVFIFASVIPRSSHPEVFYKKGILRYFANFTGKHLCQRLFLNKVAVHLWWLLLHLHTNLALKARKYIKWFVSVGMN